MSFVPLMRNPAARVKGAAISQYPRAGAMSWAIRTDRYRYVQWRTRSSASQGGLGQIGEVVGEELYDDEKDPLELANHAADPGYAETLRGLEKLLRNGPVAQSIEE